jgi:hypothetical protein
MQVSKQSKSYHKLKAEAKAPYRFIRWFLYLSLGSSGMIGGIILLMQIISGNKNIQQAFPDFFLQIGIACFMYWLFRQDRFKTKL